MAISDDAPAYTAKDSSIRGAEADGHASVFGRTITINKPADELYAWWRDFANLPRVMENIVDIVVLDETRSRWTVKGPAGDYEWIARVTADEPGRLLAWEAEDGADVKNSGRVEFRPAAPPERGTWVTAVIGYDPPGGFIGKVVGKLTQREPVIQQRRDLRRLKMLMETGEIATSTPPNPAPAS